MRSLWTVEHDSALKRTDVTPAAAATDLEDTSRVTPLTGGPRRRLVQRQEVDGGAGGWGGGSRCVTGRASALDGEEVLQVGCGPASVPKAAHLDT